MYRFIYSDEVDLPSNSHIITILQNLNKHLFKYSTCSEYAGQFRYGSAHIPGYSAELSSPETICTDLIKIDPMYQELKKAADKCRMENSAAMKLDFIKKAVIFQYYLLRIHPFADGNGRSIRGLTNLLFEKAGIVPIYIGSNEKQFYKDLFEPIDQRKSEGIELEDTDFIQLQNFYKKKVCDSIMDVVISPFSIALKEINKEKELKLVPPTSNVKKMFDIEDKKGQ